MTAYRVRIEAFVCVCVTATSNSDAKAKAELAVRQAVADSYRSEGSPHWADDWQSFGFRARGSERYESGVEDE